MTELVRVDGPDGDGIAELTLDRPDRRNALSNALRDEMSDRLDELGRRDDLKVLVVTGAGSAFSAGFDLTEIERLADDEELGAAWLRSSLRWHRACLEFPLPTIAAVNGPALAGGFDLAVMCDLRVAADTARFAHPEQAWSEVVYAPLEALVGGAVARELCLTGRPVDASEALALRLVSAVVPPAGLHAEIRRWAAMVARAPAANLRSFTARARRRDRIVEDDELAL